MPFKHCYAPVGGMNTSSPPSGIQPVESPYMRGIAIKDGELIPDYGYVSFPTAGALKTNLLHGVPLKIDTHYLTNGQGYLLALTTTNIYKYNESTETWDNITNGALIEDCEDDWVASTNVTAAAQTSYKLTGTKAVKCAIGTDFTTGIAAYENISSTDASSYTGTHFWLYSSVALTASHYSIRLSEEELGESGKVAKTLLINFNGADAATTYTTETGQTVTFVGTAQLDTAQKKFGSASLLLDGNSDSVTVPDSANWNLGSGNFTIGGWFRWATVQSSGLFDQYVDNSHYFLFDCYGGNLRLAQDIGAGNIDWGIFSFTPSQDTWYHIELNRSGNSLYCFVNGTQVGSTADVTGKSVADLAAPFRVGYTERDPFFMNGWIDSFYLVKGTAYHTANFTSPTTEPGAAATSSVDINIPAVSANTWTPVCVDADLSDLNAVLSVALIVNNDNGAVNIYLDDIKAVTRFTGDEDNRFSATIMNDYFICTNGVDQPQKWSGTGYFEDLSTTLAAGSITTSEVVFTFKDHLCLMNNTENAADAPQRVSWTNVGSIDDFINGTAGYQDLVDDVSWVIGAAPLSSNQSIIYKERSIVAMDWVGGQTPFRFNTQVVGTGSLSKDTIDSGTGEHYVVGPDLTFAYKGGTTIEVVDDKIKKFMYGRINKEYANRSFVIYIEEDDELWLCLPTDATTPDDIFVQNVIDETWYRRVKSITCAGYYQEQSSFTIGDLVGTIGDQNWRFGDALTKAYAPIQLCGDTSGYIYKLDKSVLTNNGTAITNEFQTPDFVLPDSEFYMDKDMEVTQLLYEVAGSSVTTTYSVDSGDTWSPTEGGGANTQSLSSVFRIYQQDFTSNSKKIRFKFLSTTGFKLRYYGFDWKVRGGRN
jgi:hypothetical protein